jgi:glycosyltransferase involved in cell wall biosynthesis
MQQHSLAIIWIDWYAYHVARFRAIVEHCPANIVATGIELVGLDGVHIGQKFRQDGRDGLAVTTLLPGESWHGAGQVKIAIATWKKMSELNPGTVLVPGYYNLPALAAAVWSRLHGRRTILMTESSEQDHARSSWKESLKSVVIRSLFGWAIAGGEPHVRYLQKLGFPAQRVGRFYNVVDNDFFVAQTDYLRRVQQPAAFDLPREYFLYVGRLSEEKNVLGLLEAFAGYRNRGGLWKLVIAGDGPQQAQLLDAARELEISAHVEWLGMRTTDELVKLYAFASCFVLPSTREPWGLVVNEALASGLPVIVSSRCGCAPELVRDGQNGFLFDPECAGELEQTLWYLGQMSAREREQMAAASRAIVANYSPRNWAAEVERITLAA